MTKSEIETASNTKLLMHVFGKQPGQPLPEFSKEIATVRDDEKFIAEVRAHALAEATE